jgi:cysteinyl-tRNA synthetase
VPYRKQLNFSFDVMHQAGASLRRLQDFKLRLMTENLKAGRNDHVQEACRTAVQSFEAAMDDDLNTAQALAAIFDWVRELNTVLSEGKLLEDDRHTVLGTMKTFNQVLELWRFGEDELDAKVQELIEQRTMARKTRDFALADRIRDQISQLGYLIEDTKDGVRWKKR